MRGTTAETHRLHHAGGMRGCSIMPERCAATALGCMPEAEAIRGINSFALFIHSDSVVVSTYRVLQVIQHLL